MKKTLCILILILALAAAVILPAQATTIDTTLNLNTVITGYTPDGTAPWLKAEFTSQTGSTTGTLTLTSLLNSSDFVQGATGVSGWGFTLDTAMTSLTGISCDSGTCPNTYWFGASAGSINSGPVNGPFNLAFGWRSNNRFNGSDTASLTLTFDTALTESPFGVNEGWTSYSHVQGILGNPTCSGYIGSGNGTVNQEGLYGSCSATTNVPEPQSLGMFGFGALLIGVFLGLRRRRFAS